MWPRPNAIKSKIGLKFAEIIHGKNCLFIVLNKIIFISRNFTISVGKSAKGVLDLSLEVYWIGKVQVMYKLFVCDSILL